MAAITAEALDTGFPPTTAAAIVVGLLCVAALLVPPRLLRRTGWAAVVASAALSLVTTRLGHRPEHTPGTAELCALLLLVTRAVRHEPARRMIPLATAAWSAASLVLLRLPDAEWPKAGSFGGPALLFAAPIVVVLGLYLRLLDATREREKNARLNAQRLDYARELHDFVGHHVTAITAQVKALRFTAATGHPPSPRVLDEALARIEDAAVQATDSMRSMVTLLRQPDHTAPLRAPEGLNGLRDLADALRATGPTVELTVDPGLLTTPPADHLASATHHIVREALTNVRKHAHGADTVTVDVRRSAGDGEALTVRVADNAPRTPAGTSARRPESGGFGITGLRERVHALGGSLAAGPGPAGGWQVTAEIPLGHEAPGRLS
jgi:signal transduction histidine kinase